MARKLEFRNGKPVTAPLKDDPEDDEEEDDDAESS